MRICKKCIQPDTRPNIHFNNEGICGACLWYEEKKIIDWNLREKELSDIADWAKQKSKDYDCVIGVSGGKDSTKQAITARDRLGLHCLLVNNEPENISEVGRQNIENLKQLGFDVISVRPNPIVMKTLMRKDFFEYLNPIKITEYTLWSATYIIAEKFDIPLIIQGENGGLTLGISNTGLGKGPNALLANQTSSLQSGLDEYVNTKDLKLRDFFWYVYDKEKLENMDIRGIWLNYYLKEWSNSGNAEFAKKYGLSFRPADTDPNSIGTYVKYSQLDSDLVQLNQMFKSIKLGFGQCADHANYDLRDGLITRKEAIDLVLKYDGKCSQEYISSFCSYLHISVDDFWKTVEKFRGPMWSKDNENNWKNEYHSLLKSQLSD
jgi:N-acetyl sugar amidotransferase